MRYTAFDDGHGSTGIETEEESERDEKKKICERPTSKSS
jgi:hypothetical protein